MPKLRCLNQSGIDEFRDYLSVNYGASEAPSPVYLLDDPRFSMPSTFADIEVERRDFDTRFDFASYIDERATSIGLEGVLDEPGLWEWLTVFYFDQVCPFRQDGNRTVLKVERYIPDSNRGWHYRHLLKGAYTFLRDHMDATDAVQLALAGPLYKHSGVYEHLVSRPRLRTSKGVQLAANALFYDPEKGKMKTRATSSVQEFGLLLRNLPHEYDLNAMSERTVLALLPPRFLDWIDETARVEILGDRDTFSISGDPLDAPDPVAIADVLTTLESRPLTATQRRVRSDRFRTGIMSAYGSSCAVSSIGLVHREVHGDLRYEVEAAHIIPVARGGGDVIPNGLALCRTIHWAFDNGMVWIDGEMRVGLTPEVESDNRNEWLRQYGGQPVRLPRDALLAPSTEALRWHAENVAGVKTKGQEVDAR